uniref:ATP synthase F0 subunit 8 n=1 Tax=Scolytinae sp. BMNH 1039996 TaxID=1903774 RepID=A0A343A505_9CUCU|nr:ATP synthase F0 subunit 8 [Scolytinae sp. BMNH 1039996]
MPQMAPLKWSSLYFYMTILFIMTIILSYFLHMYLPSKYTLKSYQKFMFWKW